MGKETAMVSVKLSIEEKQALQDYAKSLDLTVSQVLRRAIRVLMESENVEPKEED